MKDIQTSNLEKYEFVLKAAEMGIWEWNMQTGELIFSELMAEIIGYQLAELEPLNYESWQKYFHPNDLTIAEQEIERHSKGHSPLYEVEVRMQHKQGHYVWVLIAGKTVEFDNNNLPKRMIGFHRDITDRKRGELQLITTGHILDESQRVAKVGGWQLELASGELFWTEETYRIHEVSPESFNPRFDASVDFYLPESRVQIQQAIDKAINQGIGYDLVLQLYTANKKLIDVRTTCAVSMKDDVVTRLTGIFQDISEEKARQRVLQKSNAELAQVNEILAKSVNFDALTGLPNRNLLDDRVEQSIARSKRNKSGMAIAFIDLDKFREINDIYGSCFGDELLCNIANKLKKSLRECDTLARFGGDEFVMILSDLENIEDCYDILNRVLKELSGTIFVNNKYIQTSASIGVTLYPQDDSNADQLIRHADQAMYTAKKQGKNCFHVFDVAKDVAEKHQNKELENIQFALDNNELVLFYQPKVHMPSNKVVGLEALIRWQHPEQGILPPIAFLPIIEQDILDIKLGEWVINRALTQLRTWSEQGIDIPISVNISPMQLQSDDFVSRLKDTLTLFPDYRVGSLEFEILETNAMKEVDQVTKVISECHQLGIKFSIDDFGTGYSSLTYLKRLPTEYLKIDQSFVRDMLEDVNDKAIVQGIIGLAQTFDRSIIAEGVETIEHGEELLSLGCLVVQGYGIARPMPESDFPQWLVNWKQQNDWSFLSDHNSL